MKCVACGGTDATCSACNGAPLIHVGCPQKAIGNDPGLRDFIDAAYFASEHGLMPVAGGMLDQSASFLAAWRFWEGEMSVHRK